MKTILALVALALPAMAQTGFDFRSLDKFDAIAKNKTKVTLDEGMLKLAANFLGDGKDAAALKDMVANLKGIYVRTYEFDKKDQYSSADIEPLRDYLRQQQWSWVVQSQEGKDFSDVYVQPLQGDRLGGVAIISGEARDLTVIYISGALTIGDLQKLGGNLGIPRLNLNASKKVVPEVKKKEDEEGNL